MTKTKMSLPNPRKITFDLTVKTVRMPRPELLVPYTTNLRQHREDPKALKKQLESIEARYSAQSDVFSMVSEVKLVLESMELQKDVKGKKAKGQDGRFIAEPFNIKTQRLCNVILTPIYDKIDEWDEKNKGEHKNMKIKIAPKYAIYLCERMMEQCNEYSYVAGHIIEMHDYFLMKKKEAETVQEMIKSGAEGAEIDEAVKKINIEELLEKDEEEDK